MTNEEAIHIFNHLIQMLEEHDPESDYINAFEMAITALRNQPEWIPCEERLPEYGVAVLTYDGYCFFVEKRIPIVRDDNGDAISND